MLDKMDSEIEYLRRTQEGPINVAALKSLKQLRKMFEKQVDAPDVADLKKPNNSPITFMNIGGPNDEKKNPR